MEIETQQIPEATPESVWAAFRETDRLIKESRIEHDRDMKEIRASQKETDQLIKESRANFDREMKERRANFDREMKESQDKHERQVKESQDKYEREAKKWRDDYELRVKENDRIIKESRDDYDRRMKNFEQTMGSWSNNHGDFAEEYFFNSFEQGKNNFFGEKFDEIEKNVKGIKKGYRDEYDIVLINGKSVGIIEVKFKANVKDIPKNINKVQTFRANFPDYQNHRIYLGLASLAFYPKLEKECFKHGIAIIKQVGDTVVINDEQLKVY